MSRRPRALPLGRDGRIVLTVLLSTLLALSVLAASVLIGKLRWAEEIVDTLEPRYARLLGLQAVSEPLAAALAEVDESRARYAHPATADLDRIAADTQERVRQLVADAGLTVSGSQILPPRSHPGFVEIQLKLSINGPYEEMRQFFASLDQELPVVLVSRLELSNAVRRVRRGQPPPGEMLIAQLSLSVLRLQP